MRKFVPIFCFAFMLLGAVGMTDKSAAAYDVKSASQRSGAEKTAIAAIKKLGGGVTIDDKRPGKPVIEVILFGHYTRETDADFVHLKSLTYLRTLGLNYTEFTDRLVHLQALTKHNALKSVPL